MVVPPEGDDFEGREKATGMQALVASTAATDVHGEGKSSGDEGDGGRSEGGGEMVGGDTFSPWNACFSRIGASANVSQLSRTA